MSVLTRTEKYPEWRFLKTPAGRGSFNMAFDRVLAENYDPITDRPVFRLYSFSPPAISLGRFQSPGEVVKLTAASRDNVEVARRITGGGAIYHADELTYSMVFPRDLLSGLSTEESYRYLSSFLIKAYSKLGLDASYAGEKSSGHSEVCFAGREKYDILIEGKKAGGNAQKRYRDKIFQHGSIPFEIDKSAGKKYFKKYYPFSDSVFSFNGFNREKLIKALVDSFREQFKCILKQTDPSEEEIKKTKMLIKETRAA